MSLSEELKARMAIVLDEGKAALPESLLAKFPRSITLRSDNTAYCNPRVTADIDEMGTSDVAFVRCFPMPGDGYVLVVAAQPDQPGAIELKRGDSRRTCTFNMSAALHAFNLTFPDERKLTLSATPDEIITSQGERRILAIKVRTVASRKTRSRPRKNSKAAGKTGAAQETGAQTQPAAASATAPAAAEQPQTK